MLQDHAALGFAEIEDDAQGILRAAVIGRAAAKDQEDGGYADDRSA
ncbi:MAG: hypothetical protein ACRET6_09585 [Burkholderiales bacterium]